ncbi:MAG: 16S rRNA (cytosine(967)-C(5))-methyltransferase RsmB, partial [Selenomonadaceae bacterium]|nr:16S rRNA (cytosine(967)-C(5))-methyltransferase RsmB [Selenomonadaceae bacterium]
MDKARAAAIQVVFEVNERDAYSNIALANILRNKKLSDIDRRFCTELVYGTVKAGQSIDWIIEKYVTRSLKQIDPKILAILRVGMYQIFFLDRVPNSAVVNESVEIAKKISVGASKFVNAVLRSAVREPNKAKFPSNDSAESIALSMYHPLWLVKRWIEQFGINETKNICAADNEQPPLTLRVNLLKTTKDEVLKVLEERGVKAESSKHAAEAVVCRNLGA